LLDAGAALLCSTKKDGSLLQLLFVVDRCSCWYTVHASFPSCYERAFPFYFWIKKADEDSRTINSLEYQNRIMTPSKETEGKNGS
jgi:hypothetical protein